LKEAKETHYWLRLLVETGYLERPLFESLIKDCDELCKLLFAILKASRLNRAKAI
jgi:four helix bundle protein